MNTLINNISWTIRFIPSGSPMLKRKDGSVTVGMTDWNTKTIYLSDKLHGAFLERVLCHELCHCICFSYGIKMDIQQEEYLANWISLHGRDVIDLLDDLLYQVDGRRYPLDTIYPAPFFRA